MMTKFSRTFGRKKGRILLSCAALSMAVAGSASAQGVNPNQGALTFKGGLDVPSVYIFRGFVQERDPELTLWPYGEIDLSLGPGTGSGRSVNVNFGVWNSLQTGSSGLDGPSRRLHYWEDFFTTVSAGFGGGLKVQGGFSAHTSPNAMFETIKEFSLKASRTDWLAPYGLVAFELSDAGQADFGARKGTYLELGIGPTWALGGSKVTLGVPAKLGLSLNNYYEGRTGDEKFGFFDIGGLITLPLGGVPSRYGSWNVHGGADAFVFGDTTKAFNDGNKNKVVGLVGIGVTY